MRKPIVSLSVVALAATFAIGAAHAMLAMPKASGSSLAIQTVAASGKSHKSHHSKAHHHSRHASRHTQKAHA